MPRDIEYCIVDDGEGYPITGDDVEAVAWNFTADDEPFRDDYSRVVLALLLAGF